MRRCDSLAGLLALVTALSCAAPAGAGATTQRLDVQAFDLPAKRWEDAPQWRPMPAGKGEILCGPTYWPLPWGMPASPRLLTLKDRSYAGTELGLLESTDGQRTWSLVPQVAGQGLALIGSADGLLWVQAGDRKLGLDPTDWSVKRQTQLKAGVFAVGKEGLWVLADPKTIMGDMPVRSMTSLVLYDFEGKEIWRLRTDDPKVNVHPDDPGNPRAVMRGGVAGQIYWAGADDQAIWLCDIDFQGIMPNDAPIYGNRQLVRIDRATHKTDAWPINAWPRIPFAILSDRVLWLMPEVKPDGSDWQMQVWELTTATGQTHQVGKLRSDLHQYAEQLASDGKHLWVFAGGGPRVYRMADWVEVPLADAMPVPSDGMPVGFHAPAGYAGFAAIAADDQRLWLSGSGGKLVEWRDDGKVLSRDTAGWFKESYELRAATLPGALYFWKDGLVRIDAGSDRAQRAKLTVPPQILASDGRIWLSVDSDKLVAVAPDLSEARTLGLKEPGRDSTLHYGAYGAVALRDSLYFFASDWRVCRADAATGRLTEIGWKDSPGKQPDESLRPTVPLAWADKLSDRHVGYAFAPMDASAVRTTVLVYHTDRDSWEKIDVADRLTSPVVSPDGPIAVGRKSLWRWTGKAFERLCDHPLPDAILLLPAMSTGRYLYLQSTAGMYRIEWDKLAATTAPARP